MEQDFVSKQKLDQAYSYGVMGNLFSALEWYAYRNSDIEPKNLRFNHYNNFNSGNKKELEKLKNQIVTQIEIFKFSYLIFKKIHKKYEFPSNLSENEIIEEIEKWKDLIQNKSPENIKYYDAIIAIIKGNEISFVDENKNKLLENGADPNKMNPKFIMNQAAAVLSHTQSLANDKTFIENGNRMDLDEEEVGDKKLQKIGEKQNENQEKENELEKQFEKLIYYLEQLYVTKKTNDNDKNIELKFFKEKKSNMKYDEAIKECETQWKKFNEKYKEDYKYKNINEIKSLISHIDNLLENIKDKSNIKKIFTNIKDILNEMNDESNL